MSTRLPFPDEIEGTVEMTAEQAADGSEFARGMALGALLASAADHRSIMAMIRALAARAATPLDAGVIYGMCLILRFHRRPGTLAVDAAGIDVRAVMRRCGVTIE